MSCLTASDRWELDGHDCPDARGATSVRQPLFCAVAHSALPAHSPILCCPPLAPSKPRRCWSTIPSTSSGGQRASRPPMSCCCAAAARAWDCRCGVRAVLECTRVSLPAMLCGAMPPSRPQAIRTSPPWHPPGVCGAARHAGLHGGSNQNHRRPGHEPGNTGAGRTWHHWRLPHPVPPVRGEGSGVADADSWVQGSPRCAGEGSARRRTPRSARSAPRPAARRRRLRMLWGAAASSLPSCTSRLSMTRATTSSQP